MGTMNPGVAPTTMGNLRWTPEAVRGQLSTTTEPGENPLTAATLELRLAFAQDLNKVDIWLGKRTSPKGRGSVGLLAQFYACLFLPSNGGTYH